MKKISQIGEFGLIERIRKSVHYKDKDVICGIGDDAAVLKYTANKYLLFCSDMLVEDVHFRLKEASAFDIGRKTLGVNLSDIAAMAGIPRFCTVSVGLSANLSLRFLDEFYRGLSSIADRFSVSIVGGDTNRSAKFVVDVALIGEVEKDKILLRSGAKEGDILFVTGKLGGSIYSKHLNFIPRVNEARILTENFRINSMIDISDGLSLDLYHIAEESNTGAVIYEKLIPLSKNCKGINNALFDGEDFELLFSMPEREASRLIKQKRSLFKIDISRIGYIDKKQRGLKIVNKHNIKLPLKRKGFEHF